MTDPRASEDMDRDALLSRMANIVAEVAVSSMVPIRLVKAAAALSAEYDRTAPADPVKLVDRGPVTPASEGKCWATGTTECHYRMTQRIVGDPRVSIGMPIKPEPT